MAGKLHFELVSPERLLLSEDVDMVTAPGKEGEFGVLAGHAPFMTVIKPGIVVIEEHGRPQRKIFVRGGFAEVTPEGLTILAEYAVPIENFGAEELKTEVARANEALAAAQDDEARLAHQETLDHLWLLHTVV